MAKFWDALLESTILQGVLALLFSVTICYMYLIGRDVPESLTLILGAIIGFYFRSKASVEVRKAIATDQGE